MVDFSTHITVGGMTQCLSLGYEDLNFDDSVENYKNLSQFRDRTMDIYEVIQYAQGEPLESTRYNYEGYTGTLY